MWKTLALRFASVNTGVDHRYLCGKFRFHMHRHTDVAAMRSVDKPYYQLSYNEEANLHYLSSKTFKCESESE